MADKLTIARPYARAAFEEARGKDRLGAWSDSLKVAGQVVQDPRVENLLGNPHVTPEQLAQLFIDIAGPALGEHGANFVRTLAANRRLAYLPEISALFEALKDEAQGVADVTVTSAAAARCRAAAEAVRGAGEAAEAQGAPAHRDGPRLIGGAIVRAGDLVIDGSLSTRLERIAYELTA